MEENRGIRKHVARYGRETHGKNIYPVLVQKIIVINPS